MVTYDSLFTYTLVIIGILTLVLGCTNRNKQCNSFYKQKRITPSPHNTKVKTE